MKVELTSVCKNFGAVEVVKGMDMAIKDGEFVAFLGPSGCGKTTTLFMIAGIYRVSGGTIAFDGKNVNQVAPKDRDIGMVFQSYALYPHMTVFDNIVFPLTLRNVAKDEQRREAQRLAEMLGLAQLLERKPAMLSGGQQQRVAIARALIKKPKLLLFDEPLSNLDARLRMKMRAEIKRLQRELGITTIYVTHDQVEAMTMADRIAVMKDGILQALDTPQVLHDRPATQFIGEFIGNPPMNFFDVELQDDGATLMARSTDLACAVAPERRPRGDHQDGQRKVILGVRPQHIRITDDPDCGHQAVIDLIEPLGRDDLVMCRLGEHSVNVLCEPRTGIRIGDSIALEFDMQHAQFFDPVTGESLLWAASAPVGDASEHQG